MTDILHRYPGAQPFRDDELSRRTFFGREPASIALTDQILANRLVVVYAKSGLGKTSLLNAGVAPRLREAASLPLFVRVNDLKHGPLFSVLDAMRGEAERQQVEYVPGDTSSLWSFFKTAEFWRGDLLLTPVLILDQFEELFTLQSPEARETFLSELGFLIRGIPPPSQPQQELDVSEAPPTIRVVLSLREDFLGLLEEASDRIPEIMDHRYRVAPLTREMAAKAITGPAAIEHSDMETKAFRLEPEFVTSILDYLTGSTAMHSSSSRYVEPFHLQLICQRIERVVAAKQKMQSGGVVLNFKDLGGEAALTETLESFYADAIRSLPGRHLRGAVRILCEQLLISPEGRRLSVEEREIRRQLKLPRETLSHLVERRLLRTDRRSDSTYYELSHDTLVQPVLASRRMQALLVGWAAVLAGALTALASAFMMLVCFALLVTNQVKDSNTALGLAIFAVFLFISSALGVIWFRAGVRRRRRYRRHTPSEFTQALPTLLPLRSRLLGWGMVLTGPIVFATWGFAGAISLLMLVTVAFTRGSVPRGLIWLKEGMHEAWQLLHDHPIVEFHWTIVEYAAIAVLGWFLFRRGIRKLWPHKFRVKAKVTPVPGVDQPPSIVWAAAKMLCGVMVLVVAIWGIFTLRMCAVGWHGSIPNWLNLAVISYRFSGACQTFYQKSWDWNGISFVLFFVAVLVFSAMLLRRGILDVSTAVRHHQLVWPQMANRRAMISAGAGGILIIALLLFWTHSRSRAVEKIVMAQKQPMLAVLSESASRSGWAVGNNATILHTEDGGRTWKRQSDGSGWFYSVTFTTLQSGWAVGPGGTIWHTGDGGATWQPQTSGTKTNLSVVTFATPRSGWVVGYDGTILHTEDAGGTWKSQKSSTNEMLHAVAFVTPRSGWAVGDSGTILHTEDGGTTWKAQKSGTAEGLNFVAFATPHVGWATGSNGAILHTEDDGNTWTRQTSGTIRDLVGIAFASPLSVWIVGTKGAILHTENGGSTWTPQDSGVRADLLELAFTTSQSGWAVGHGGIVLHTDDGGNTWALQNSGTRSDLQSVSFAKPYGVIGIQFDQRQNPATAGIHSVSRGVVITRVIPRGPAYDAGLSTGDTILSVNSQPVKTGEEFIDDVSSLRPGTDARLTYIHNGKEKTADVTIADGSKLFNGTGR